MVFTNHFHPPNPFLLPPNPFPFSLPAPETRRTAGDPPHRRRPAAPLRRAPAVRGAPLTRSAAPLTRSAAH
ncbi:hypothetical protein Syun_006941 [Stephania yunnanensis]|uniref:Uncharacterized protein n=1 Tax=Stephania yunnanensis TaxID=152371 RepID=A0AAP0PYY6_9MAGN